MATENISTGNFYRILKDKATSTWDRISFWTHASDVELSSGTSLETDLSNKTTQITNLQSDFAQIETSTVSSHVYTKGMMLVLGGQLYRATSAIAVGETFVVGTNIEVASVGTLANMLTASNGNQFYLDVLDNKYGFYPNASKTASEFVPFGGSTSIVAYNYYGFGGSFATVITWATLQQQGIDSGYVFAAGGYSIGKTCILISFNAKSETASLVSEKGNGREMEFQYNATGIQIKCVNGGNGGYIVFS